MRLTALKSLFASLSTILIFSACGGDEPIPAYLIIESAQVNASSDIYGSVSEKVTDVWVSEDENFIGVYELPATIPVLSEGETKILIYPGVKQGGIHSDRRIYPFYNAYSEVVNMEPNVDIEITPEFEYNVFSTLMILNADFEVASELESKVEGSDLIFNVNNDKVFEGSRSIEVVPSPTDSLWRIESITKWEADLTRSTWLEFNYRCNEPMELVIFVAGQAINAEDAIVLPYTYLVITPQEDWNKMYVEISEILAEGVEALGNSAQNFAFSFSFQARSEDPSTAEYLFDNIKVITTN